jgi:stage II sporulation protein AB (anti-sigma F factor)
MEVSYRGSELRIVVEDFGKGIEDIDAVQEVGFTSIPEERMGLGFTFMHEYMDEVMVASQLEKGTKVTMVKRVRELES